MLSVNQSVEDAFPFFQQIIQDAFKIDSCFLSYPYGDLSRVDWGFRKMMWTQYPMPIQGTYNSKMGYRLMVVKSSLGFYNIVAFVSIDKGEHPDFISIGPFCMETFSYATVKQFTNNNSYSVEFIHAVREFYRRLPLADVNDVISITTHLLSIFLPDFLEITPEFLNYSEEKHDVIQNEETMNDFSFHTAELYAEILNRFLEALCSGNSSMVHESLKQYLAFVGITEDSPLAKIRKILLELNAHCKGTLLNAAIHPFYILNLFQSYETAARTTSSPVKLRSLAFEMCRKYCLLVNNYGLKEYSYLVRNVIKFMRQHLDEKLSLSILAEHFQKNASALSSRFSKETGKSITEWIHEQRIREALKYFNTTDFPVADVAYKVGFQDLGYFSKIFKRYIGSSPSAYQKMMRRLGEGK